MSLFDGDSRDELRRTYTEAWRKHASGALLTPLEALVADVIGAHPEYQGLLANAEAAREYEAPAGGGENPFLHMGLHLAVREQVALDRPPGVRDLHRDLQASHGDAHGAEHVLMEALGEALWQAQRAGRAPDENDYLAAARRELAARHRGRPQG